jgi:TIR domain
MSHVFVSYAREDRDKAKLLAEALGRRGISVWWDRQVLPGEVFEEVIAASLTAAKAVIVLWSRTSVKSRWVKDEAGQAADRGVLFPARIDEVDIPLGFGQVQTADLAGWTGEASHPELDRLLAGLERRLGLSSHKPAEGPVRTAPPQKPARPAGKQPWRAELVEKTLSRIVIRVHLSHGQHTVEFCHQMTKALDAESLKLDGVVVGTGGTLATWKKEFDFKIPDGPTEHPAKFKLDPNIWLATIKRFQLTVAGQVLYQHGTW